MSGRGAILEDVFDRLMCYYGPQSWWPADSPFEVMVGAVLVQATSWSNVERAIENLKAAKVMAPAAIRKLSQDELEGLVRPSGFYRPKAQRLRALCEYLGSRFADDIDSMAEVSTCVLRDELLAVHGIGDETADDILLYALGRPVFVVDAYTRRVFSRLGMCEPDVAYRRLQAMFHHSLPRSASMYNEYHALIVAHATAACRVEPTCLQCPLNSICPRVGL